MASSVNSRFFHSFEAKGVEGQAATGGGVSDWQAERRLRRRGASGAEPDRSGASWLVVVKRDVEENVAAQCSAKVSGRRRAQLMLGARA